VQLWDLRSQQVVAHWEAPPHTLPLTAATSLATSRRASSSAGDRASGGGGVAHSAGSFLGASPGAGSLWGGSGSPLLGTSLPGSGGGAGGGASGLLGRGGGAAPCLGVQLDDWKLVTGWAQPRGAHHALQVYDIRAVGGSSSSASGSSGGPWQQPVLELVAPSRITCFQVGRGVPWGEGAAFQRLFCSC
jgi:hypothetical protein